MPLLLMRISTELAVLRTPPGPEHLAIPVRLYLGFHLPVLGHPLCHPSQRPPALLLAHPEVEEMRARQVGWWTRLAPMVGLLHLVRVEVVQILLQDHDQYREKKAFA